MEDPAASSARGEHVANSSSRQKSRRRSRSARIIAAITAGGIAALVGGLAWATLIFAFHLRLGFMAIGVGAIVGFAVRQFGRGHSEIFGMIAIIMALAGCALGDVLGGVALVAHECDIPFLTVLSRLNGSTFMQVLGVMFSPMDVIFYLIALFAAYKQAVIGDEF